VQARNTGWVEASNHEPEQRVEGGEERDEVLSPEEERFVAMFVEYWQRRGANLLSEAE
jgi:hypothetical protein